MLTEIGRRDVLLEVADEERARGFGMILVEIGLQRSEFVVVDVQTRIPRRHFDLAAEEQLVTRHLQRLVHVFRFLEPERTFVFIPLLVIVNILFIHQCNFWAP